MTADFLKLTVVEKMDENGKRALFSKDCMECVYLSHVKWQSYGSRQDNRRLYCLKEYQKRCGSTLNINIMLLSVSTPFGSFEETTLKHQVDCQLRRSTSLRYPKVPSNMSELVLRSAVKQLTSLWLWAPVRFKASSLFLFEYAFLPGKM